ncbi:haloacid dehalogenase-like hydrolase [Pseudokineococcus lusitanus]|uniref:Phosphatidylglycerophosphatase C n=1 Tax=Pseudokineococcus lusitanus TaxID=763993 RepID=A0A3N1HKA6_9ACTN|nr:haloacid dehalogenase-like hydrolase [Pseudokineococcus lusitanus]ROP42896.1 phosphatidylglycerophosphatase C [Pseudokineococcus lusitanus]
MSEGASGPTPGRAVVVFDLDGTLLSGDAFALFLVHLLRRPPARAAVAVVTAPVWLPAFLLTPTRLAAERYLVWWAAVGMDDETFTARAARVAADHAGPLSGRATPAVIARLREHQGRGDRVVVATGCASPLAEHVCVALGLDDVEVVASTLTRTRWGLPRAVPARGEGKLRALASAGVTLPVDHAYSDSPTDLPLLRAARVPHVVDASPRHLRRLRRALGPDVDVISTA